MASSPTTTSQVDDNDFTVIDSNGNEERLTFSQLIENYHDDSMFNDSASDCNSVESVTIQSHNNDDVTIVEGPQSQSEDSTLEVDEYKNDSRLTQNLRNYLEKECFTESAWSNELFFNGSTDKKNFTKMDITRYVGDSKFKMKTDTDMFKIYFNPEDYPVKDEISKMSQLLEDIPLKEKVQSKFKSPAYMKLSKDLREASGQCGFHIVQNGNQKIDLKRNGLKIRNRFCCQRYSVYKGQKKDITGVREYRRYTLHNDRKNQRSQGRKKCRRSYSLKSLHKECRCKFFSM